MQTERSGFDPDDPYAVDPNADPSLDPATSRSSLVNGVTSPEAPQPAGTDPNTALNQIYGPGGTAFNPPYQGATWNPQSQSWNPQAAAPQPAADPTRSAIEQLYQRAGITDGGRGSGFADEAYWAEHPSEVANGRLAADLAGTGSDQPTGTPGSGVWQNSGRNAAPMASPASSSPGAAPLSQPMMQSSFQASSMPASDPAVAQFNQQMRDLLLSQVKGLSTPETADSADIQPAISAYNNQSTRDQQDERDALAERFYASSGGGSALDSGGFNTAVQRGAETAAGNRANFVGSTVQQANTARRTQLTTLLNTAVTAGDTQSAQEIQKQIASIDAILRQQGITNQNTQFGQSLSQQDQQYYDALDKQYADLGAQMNRDTLLAGLRG